jgi:hypothetical protein
MKTVIGLSIAIACMVVLYGCAGSDTLPWAAPTTPVASASCAPDGSFVPFSQATAVVYARNYQGCNFKTTAEFVGAGAAGFGLAGIENDHVIIRVVAPGEQAPSGLQAPNFVALPQVGSDLAFLLKPGDTIILTGRPFVHWLLPSVPIFMATSIERAK